MTSLTLHGPIGPPDQPPEPVEPGASDDAAEAAAGAVERLVTSGVPGWRLVAGLVALVWIYRRRVLLPAAAIIALVLFVIQLTSTPVR